MEVLKCQKIKNENFTASVQVGQRQKESLRRSITSGGGGQKTLKVAEVYVVIK